MRDAGLVLYLVYLLLEKALVGWVTILVELLVALLLMLYKIWLDHWERCAAAPSGHRLSVGSTTLVGRVLFGSSCL